MAAVEEWVGERDNNDKQLQNGVEIAVDNVLEYFFPRDHEKRKNLL